MLALFLLVKLLAMVPSPTMCYDDESETKLEQRRLHFAECRKKVAQFLQAQDEASYKLLSLAKHFPVMRDATSAQNVSRLVKLRHDLLAMNDLSSDLIDDKERLECKMKLTTQSMVLVGAIRKVLFSRQQFNVTYIPDEKWSTETWGETLHRWWASAKTSEMFQ